MSLVRKPNNREDGHWLNCRELEESVSSIDWSGEQSLNDDSMPSSLLGRLPSEEKDAALSTSSNRWESRAQASSSSSLSRWDSGSSRNAECMLSAMSNSSSLNDSRRSSASGRTSRISRASRIGRHQRQSSVNKGDHSPCLIRRQATLQTDQDGKNIGNFGLPTTTTTTNNKKDQMPSLVRRQMTTSLHKC